jgi:adenylate cyclase
MNKIKGKEIERKFWVHSLPSDYDKWPCTSIRQGYLSIDPNGTEVRIRKEDEDCTLTVKSGKGLTRTEISLDLTLNEYSSLWPLTSDRKIFKKRYKIKNEETLLLELDVFEGSLEGLFVVEIEFPSTKDASLFSPLAWMTREITGLESFYTRNLWRFRSYLELKEMFLALNY